MNYPPKLLLRFLRWFCRPELLRYIEGDLLELYEENARAKGSGKANWMFAWEVVKLFRPGVVRSLLSSGYRPYTGLIGHYLLVFRRSFARQRAHALINLSGLAVGFAAALVIYEYVRFERSYDQFHTGAAHMYRLTKESFRGGQTNFHEGYVWSGLGEEAKTAIPGIEQVVRVHPLGFLGVESLVIGIPRHQSSYYQQDLLYVDEAFLELFDFPVKYGSQDGALKAPNHVVLTKESAIRYFEKEDAVGEVIKVHAGSASGEFVVAAVLDDLPANTHLNFGMLLPLDFLLTHYGAYTRYDGWEFTNFATYVKLDGATDPQSVEEQLAQLVDARLGDTYAQHGEQLTMHLQAVGGIHLHTDLDMELNYRKGSSTQLMIVAGVGSMVLLIAWLNYINLFIGRVVQRGREVGVRKSMGAYSKQLTLQVLVESVVLHVMAIVLALALLLMVRGPINEWLGLHLSLVTFSDVRFWVGVLSLAIFGGVVTGVYPASLLLRFQSIALRAGTFSVGGHWMRRGLIFTQLMMSMLLVSGAYLVMQQVNYMRQQNLGVEMEQLLVLAGPLSLAGKNGNKELKRRHQLLKHTLLANPNISGITGSSNIPSSGQMWKGNLKKMGTSVAANTYGDVVLVDADFSKVFDLPLVAGGHFAADVQDYEALIVNEKALEVFGLGKPEEVIGQRVVMDGADTVRIDGVVKDFHWNSLHTAVAPLMLLGSPGFNANLSIRVSTEHMSETLDFIAEAFAKLYPDDPYRSYFLDDRFNRQYHADEQFGRLVAVFSVLAIFIACVGLFSLVSFTASQKVKELGIRKVLGASLANLMLLLSREYLTLLVIAILGAGAIGLWLGSRWLENFAYRLPITPVLFLVPALVLTLIALCTVAHRVITSARANPVDSLRNE